VGTRNGRALQSGAGCNSPGFLSELMFSNVINRLSASGTSPMPFLVLFLLGCLAMTGGTSLAQGTVQGAPDVLILGDSQLTFGAGEAFLDEIQSIAGSCGLQGGATTGIIGVRSSAISSWTGKGKAAKGAICDVDPKWNVNAAAYGSLSPGENPYVQIGRGAQFQFCRPGLSPLQSVFAERGYAPDLFVMFLLGNAAGRWANSADAALQDVRALMADLPKGQPCIFMTSAPPYREKEVGLRQQAQDNIERAFTKADSRCSFVPGFTAQTIRENQGNAANFRRNGSGAVKDPFHPTERAARKFLKLQRGALCKAIQHQLRGS